MPFEALFDDFLGGQAKLEELESAIAKIMAGSPASTRKLKAALHAAHQRGLPDPVYVALLAQFPETGNDTDETLSLDIEKQIKADKALIENHREFQSGSVLRQRFRLLSTLGEGGMSTVWKAIDLLKEEARDPYPYVAVKLLSEDFREHPEAFIALQRESSKAMRLAHPNIATVYDFDRDGNTIYMTMEVLEGKDLTTVIRHIPAEGLAVEEAMDLIEQLASGLSYAHAAKLVHSDLKPGNAFLTHEGVVKLLDFGIARASKTHADEDGEITLFDPGTLGALTPTYATLEMFEGLDPDPRDDIYALAIISYQLFSGRHPYAKQSAPKAVKNKLRPAPILRLSKRQNRGLLRALALHRADRTATVDEFLHELRPRKSYTRQIIAAGIAGLLLTAGLAYKPVSELGKSSKQHAVISQLLRGDAAGIRSGLEQLHAFDDEQQHGIKQNEKTRTALITYYLELKETALNAQDYPAAEQALHALTALYPDSATAFKNRSELKVKKAALLKALHEQYQLHLKRGNLLAIEKREDIHDVLRILARVDPDNSLLKDRQLPLRYETLIRAAMKANKALRTRALLGATATYFPNNKRLKQLRIEITKRLELKQNILLIASIQQRIKQQKKNFKSLDDFQPLRGDLVQLSVLNPDGKLLKELQENLKGAFQQAIEKHLRNQRWAVAESLLFQFAPLFNLSDLLKRREQLSSAEARAGFQLTSTPEHIKAISHRQNILQKLLAEPPLSSDWENTLRAPFKELIALLPAGDPRLKAIVTLIAQHYLQQPNQTQGANRFAEALRFLKREHKPSPPSTASNKPRKTIGADQQPPQASPNEPGSSSESAHSPIHGRAVSQNHSSRRGLGLRTALENV